MDKISNSIADLISNGKDNTDAIADFISDSKDNIDAIADFILNETPQGFDAQPTLKNQTAHLEMMRDSMKSTLGNYCDGMAEVSRNAKEFIALERGGPAKPCDNSNSLREAVMEIMTDPGLVAETFHKYLLPEDTVLPLLWVDKEGSVTGGVIEFENCLFCIAAFYAVWHSAAVRKGFACPAGLVLQMAEVSLTLSQGAWYMIGVCRKDISIKALLGSQKTRKRRAKAVRGVVFDAICAKKPGWFRRYGVSMGSVAKDLIRETKIDRTPKQVIKYIRDGLSRGDFADTGLEEVLREIYCKILKKGNLL